MINEGGCPAEGREDNSANKNVRDATKSKTICENTETFSRAGR